MIFAVSALDTYLRLFGMDAHVSRSWIPMPASLYWAIIFPAAAPRAENLMLAGGAISFAVTCYIFFSHGWYDAYVYNTAPTMMLFTAALFVAAKRLAVRQKVLCGLPGLISRYSFSIILIHWAALHVIVRSPAYQRDERRCGLGLSGNDCSDAAVFACRRHDHRACVGAAVAEGTGGVCAVGEKNSHC